MADFRIFALLVGIDEYKAELIPNLRGCAADVRCIQQYLVDTLHVPLDHILMLTDNEATREAILQAFRDHFVHNDRIVLHDTILFFFAGHGSRGTAPAEWATDEGYIETICPHDESVSTDDRPDVFGIPARTLWALTHELSDAKGPNMITILDCCHSGDGVLGRVARRYENRVIIPATLDEQIWGLCADRHDRAAIPSRFLHRNMSSHVLLTACCQNQLAYELDNIDDSRGGAFTHALVKTLHHISLRQTTYAGLLNLLPSLPDQDPQCEGDNKYCLLFTTIPQLDMLFFAVQKSNPDGFEVNAGKIEGVAEYTEFRLYKEANVFSTSLGVYITTSVSTTSCKIAPKFPPPAANMPHLSYALVSRWEHPDAKLAVFVDLRVSSAMLLKAFSSFQMADVAPYSVIRVSSSSDADIALHDEKGLLHLIRTDRLIGIHANPHIEASVEVNPDRILRVLRSVAHFKFYLGRANESSPLHGSVRVELHQLEESDDGRYVPTGDNLVEDGQARIGLNDEPHGITLCNDSQYDLFPSLFYFDPSDYSIQPWYIPPSSAMPAPLRSTSELLVAHGNQGGHIIKFTLKPGELSDTGFLILYLSTKYSDMTHVQQDGAFNTSSRPEVLVERAAHAAKGNGQLWSTTCTILTVVRSDALKVRPLRPSSAADAPTASHLSWKFVFYPVLGSILVASFCYLFAHQPFFA